MVDQEKRKYSRVNIQNVISYICLDDQERELSQGAGEAINIGCGGMPLLEAAGAFLEGGGRRVDLPPGDSLIPEIGSPCIYRRGRGTEVSAIIFPVIK